MKKFKIFYDKDKEEAWLNKMCEEGWAVKKFFFGMYTFEKCEKGEYIYQIDLLDDKNKNEFLDFLKENGVEAVFTWGRWVVFRKKASEGSFELYSDSESQMEQYKKIRNLFILSSTSLGFISISQILNITNSSISIGSMILVFGIEAALLGVFIKSILTYNNKITRLKQV